MFGKYLYKRVFRDSDHKQNLMVERAVERAEGKDEEDQEEEEEVVAAASSQPTRTT